MEITDEIVKGYEPKSAFVLYSNDRKHYVENHKVHNGKLMGGKPLSIEAIKSLKELLDGLDVKSHDTMKGEIPKGLLYIDSDKINPKVVWITKSNWRVLTFSKEIGLKDVSAEVPKLLWVYTAQGTSVFAIKGTSKDSKVYNAPFWNVSDSGSICFGNVDTKLDLTDIGRAMKRVEDNFFNSQFTPHYDFKGKYKIAIKKLWSNDNAKWTFNSLLMPNSRYKTINDIL